MIRDVRAHERNARATATLYCEPLERRQMFSSAGWVPYAQLIGQDQATLNFPKLNARP